LSLNKFHEVENDRSAVDSEYVEDKVLMGFQDFARTHCSVVERFGRYPKRNAVLNRETTPEEQTYIDETAGEF
jgi:uncharacterized protein (DUF924 family)